MDRKIKIIFIVLGTLAFAVVAALMIALDIIPFSGSRDITVNPSAASSTLPTSTDLGAIAASSAFLYSSATPSGNIFGESGNMPIIASSLLEVDANRDFLIAGLPNLQFHINKIYKASGGLSSDICGISYGKDLQYILIKNRPGMVLPGSLNEGYCFSAPDNPVAGQGFAGLVVVDLEIKNIGDRREDGKFLNLLYAQSGSDDTRVAGEVPNWLEYGASPSASENVLIGFEVPADQTEVELVYGNYSAVSSKYWNAEDVLGKTISGFTIDFNKKTVEEIAG